ncbi:MAG TPA: valine--tRNA ligase, partial [Methanothrix sp.]|nr:valine--tRNA ligase [Methanothrix sp.]
WCPRCGTAIAFAEVEYDSRTTSLNYLLFGSDLGDLEIATSRPELLAACVAVAVHPEDEERRKYIGTEVRVPVFDYSVPVIADEVVDPAFGTGVVMICTFGDKQDVRWWVEHDLPLRQAIDRAGRMTEVAGKFAGMKISECKDAIIEEMRSRGIIRKQEPLDQNVGLCWRCKTAIEILSERQWFVKIDPGEIIKTSAEIKWVPEHMETRLKNWTGTMDWDWCISRQRIFATPIPVWYCKSCGEPLVAREEWLPLDPNLTKPPVSCPKCGSEEFEPETDVLDTWMDSSISVLNVTGWLSDHPPRYPAQLRPQGHDIIRTWAFYTILRAKALVGTRPWDSILVNGMVLGEDGHKMSKSLNNFIAPEEVVEKYGADAFRQWAAVGGSPGSDVMFRWKDVISGGRFLQKLWSMYRFSAPHAVKSEDSAKNQVDRWLLFELSRTVEAVTESMDRFAFDEAFRAIRSFAWDELADNYIELVKSRLYGPDGPEKRAAQSTIYSAIEALTSLLAPFTPFIAEEIRMSLSGQSVHAAPWPEPQEIRPSPEGSLIKEVAAAVRRYKSDRGMALNSPLAGIEVYSDLDLETTDLSGSTGSPVTVKRGSPEIETRAVEVKPQMKVIGPVFKDRSGEIIRKLRSMDPEAVAIMAGAGKIVLELGDGTAELGPEALEIATETLSAGRAVDMMVVEGGATVLIRAGS